MTSRIPSARPTRREFLRAGGLGILALGGCLGDDAGSEWIAVKSPTEMTLFDVAMTRAGPHAVGEGGRLLARHDGSWSVAVENGPSGAENAIRGAAATDNGRHLWVAGDSAIVGLYDVDDQSMTDYSAPEGMTSTWEAVAVVGLADEEWVYLANGSGEIVRATHTEGKVEWGDPVKPGSGSSITSVEFTGRGFGFVTDTSSNVFQTVDGGKSWRRIGIRRGSVNLHDLAPLHSNEIGVVGDSGSVFSYNGFTWTRSHAGENALLAIERNRDRGLVVGDSGEVFRLTTDGWSRERTETGETLHGVCLATTDNPAVAVGESGMIVEYHDT